MLYCITIGSANIPFQSVIRVPTTGVRMTDVLTFNCQPGTVKRGSSGRGYYGANFQRFDLDEDKLGEPVFTDYGEVLSGLTREVFQLKATTLGKIGQVANRGLMEKARDVLEGDELNLLA
jgi:hypothetical protein